MAQAKLIIGGLVVLAFMALGLVAYHYKLEAKDALVARDAAIRDKETAEAVAKQNAETVGRLKAQADKDAALAAKLADQLADSNDHLTAEIDTRHKAERENEAARNFLNLRIPDSLLGGVPIRPEADSAARNPL
ncbi:MAG: hypothetical protein EOQ55_27215 [Mesorhizobium sp.]|uniref:hypothetical protein n=1 Tax=Mesorhizobium sp. TaxID=1871066 RepID=UPI000FE7EA04|nr:hypothetical protein [Mesorhizobium sp.]RWG12245.1 MAG: hypothetical protein EOQ55_27215 [Mesorhizobium sp.]